MRFSKMGDPYAQGLAYVTARLLYLRSKLDGGGEHRAMEREVKALETLLAKLDEFFPPSTTEEATALAEDHHRYVTERWGSR